MDEAPRIVSLEEVPEDGTVVFTARDEDGTDEVVLTRREGEVMAYRNTCPHWTDVRLDSGDGALVRNGELVCTRHGATFERDSGYCNFGPPEGAVLDAVEVTVRDDAVYLTDDDYEFAHRGLDETRESDSDGRMGFSGP